MSGKSDKRTRIIGILLITAFILIFAGSWQYYIYLFPGDYAFCAGMTFQNSAEALLFNPVLTISDIVADAEFLGTLTTPGIILMSLSVIAMAAAPFIDILVVFSVIDSFTHLFSDITLKKKRILVIGYNESSRKLLLSECEKGKLYLWTDRMLSDEEERELYDNRVSVRYGELSGDDKEDKKNIDNLERFLRLKKITHIIFLDGSNARNMQNYMTVMSTSVCKQKTIHMYVMNDDFESGWMLRNYFDRKLSQRKEEMKASGEDDTHMDIHIFDLRRTQAEDLFEKLPLHKGLENDEKKDVHVLIVGSDRLSDEVILQAMNQGVFTPNNKIILDVVGNGLESMRKRFAIRFMGEYLKKTEEGFSLCTPDADGELLIRFNECDLSSEEAAEVIRTLQQPAKGGRYTYLVLCGENADENIHFISLIERFELIGGGKVPTAVKLPRTKDMKDFLGDFSFGSELFLMGESEEYLKIDDIIRDDEERAIRMYNAVYDAMNDMMVYESGKVTLPDEEKRDKKWNKLEYYKRESNRALYFHRIVKKDIFINQDDEMKRFRNERSLISSEGKDKDLVWSEHLMSKEGGEYKYPSLVRNARTEHRRWDYFFASRGWSYGDKKAPMTLRHDCLMDWENLEEKKKSTLIYDLISSPVLMKEAEEKV